QLSIAGKCQNAGTKPCSAESRQRCKTFCFSEIAFPVLDYEVQLIWDGRAEWLQYIIGFALPGNLRRLMLGRLFTSAKALETIDERLMRCGVSRRAFLQFCSTLMVAAPFGLAITDKKTPEEVAAGLGKVIRPPVIWLHFQDCTGCTETLLRPSPPDLGDLILNIISLEYHETLMAGSGKQAEAALAQAVD